MKKLFCILLFIPLFSIGQIVPFGFMGTSASGFDADYQAILDEGTTQGYTLPSASEQTAQNAILAEMKSQGVWDSLDQFYWFEGASNQDGFKGINWKNPTGTKITLNNGAEYVASGLDLDGNASNQNALPDQSLTYHNSDGSGITIGNVTGNRGDGDVLLGVSSSVNSFLLTASAGTFSDRYWDISIFVERSTSLPAVEGYQFDGTDFQPWRNGATVGTASSAGFVDSNLNASGTWYIGSTGSFELNGIISFFAIGGNYSQSGMYTAITIND